MLPKVGGLAGDLEPVNTPAQDAGADAMLLEAQRLCRHARELALGWRGVHFRRSVAHVLEDRLRTTEKSLRGMLATPAAGLGESPWLIENRSLIRTAQREARDALKDGGKQINVEDASGAWLPRHYVLSRAYLDAVDDQFSEGSLSIYIRAIQEVQEIDMVEIWALKSMLQLILLERIAAAHGNHVSAVHAKQITSLREIGETVWKELFEQVNLIDPVLRNDPAGAYRSMDYDSRELYRKVVAELALRSDLSEREVAQAAVDLAEETSKSIRTDQFDTELEGRETIRRCHIGYYLIDSGLAALRHRIRFRPPFMRRIRDMILHAPNGFYLIGVELTTFGIVVFLLSGLTVLTPILAGLLLLLLPATQAAVDFINNVASFLIPPRRLPRLDFSEGVPDNCVTMVAVPTLLLSSAQVQGLVRDLEIRYLGNPDRNIYFALLTDAPDSSQPVDEKDNLVDACREMIEGLNRQYGTEAGGPFYLFHRSRLFNPVEGTWMGWERKRGKLLELNQLLRNQLDSFPVKVGDLSVLPRIRYVITLDSDTQLPRDSAHKLIGTLAHPLNQAVIDPVTNMVVEGYGILQPRVGVSIQSAARSRLAAIYSGQTGFDIYTRAISDVYQDVYGEGIFTGKGIYEVDVLRAVLEQRFPSNTLLSHDLIEGAYARAGLVSDIEVIDDYPSHFSAYSRRKHRWVRGDWQIMRWLLPKVPDYSGSLISNPISLVSHWKIVDNLRRSLFDPAALLLLLAGWFYLPGGPLYWTIASVVLLLIPVYSQLVFTLARIRGSQIGAKVREALIAFGKSHFSAFLQIVFLMHQALLSLDAIIRSMVRTTITRKRLLEWETAAEAETTSTRKRTPADTYLHWAPWIAIGITILLWLVRPQALPVAGPILFLWFSSRAISDWLNRPPRSHRKQLTAAQQQDIRLMALRTWRYFREFSNEETNWLIPDNVREASGAMANRVSPTNLGLLLNSRIAALELGYLTLPEFVEQTRRTLDTVLRLPRFRGHLVNWYDTQTLEALEPGFVSTVDSGNLAVCLWTLQEAALAWQACPDLRPMLWKGLRDHVELLAELQPSLAEPLCKHAATMGLEEERSRDALDEVLLLANQIGGQATGDAGWWAVELANRIRFIRESEASAFSEEIREGLRAIAEISGRLVAEMDFRFLYLRRKKVLSVGYDVSLQRLEPSSYDLLASESRMASFIAIAKGDIPQEAWFHLGRKHTLRRGRRILLSWTGTMFEYLMPTIWMEHYRDTVLERSVRSAVHIQQKEARSKGTPWGISESAYGIPEEGCEYSYAPFGVPGLAVKETFGQPHVISPYSTFLALLVDPPGAYKNLCRMRDLGWLGSYGFYESADYSASGRHECNVVRSWMAHHQALSLLPVCNILAGSPMQRFFHNEPRVLATELLLHERASNTLPLDTQTDEQAPVTGAPEAIVAAG